MINYIVTVLELVGGAPAQGWGGDTARRRGPYVLDLLVSHSR
jgi:hypothetical protein